MAKELEQWMAELPQARRTAIEARAGKLITLIDLAMSELAVAAASAPGRTFNPAAGEAGGSTANWYIAKDLRRAVESPTIPDIRKAKAQQVDGNGAV
jgi:hypothetical protein